MRPCEKKRKLARVKGKKAKSHFSEILMLSEERRREIMELLRNDGRVLVRDLAKQFRTSLITIRKDLESLHHKGLLERTHGGALPLRTGALQDQTLREKERLHKHEKLRIAEAAVPNNLQHGRICNRSNRFEYNNSGKISRSLEFDSTGRQIHRNDFVHQTQENRVITISETEANLRAAPSRFTKEISSYPLPGRTVTIF
jgi:Mn-dependent DtxR family transcriptional regulator